MDTAQIPASEVLKLGWYRSVITHAVPSLAVVLLLALDFKMSGRIGMVNKPMIAVAVAPLVGVLVGFLLHSLMRKPWSIAIYYAVHLVISTLMVFLFFAVFVKDSL